MAAKNKKKRSWKDWLFYIVIIVLLVVGIGLVFHTQIEGAWIGYQSHTKVSNVSKAEMRKGANNKNADYSSDNVKAVGDNSISDSSKAAKANAIGKIKVPSVGIDLPIYEGLNNYQLTLGAGTMHPNQQMGGINNYALAGHHMENPKILFSPLAKVKTGQMIDLTDAKKTYHYKIADKKIVPETDTSVLDNHPGKRELTLVTCASGKPGETRRLIITAYLVK